MVAADSGPLVAWSLKFIELPKDFPHSPPLRHETAAKRAQAYFLNFAANGPSICT
jgi:hypothetical protein